jgi:hypothetical protein
LQTPRTAASLVISVEWNDQNFNRQMPRPSGRNGRAPWTSADSQTPTWHESNSPPKSSVRARSEGPGPSDEQGNRRIGSRRRWGSAASDWSRGAVTGRRAPGVPRGWLG